MTFILPRRGPPLTIVMVMVFSIAAALLPAMASQAKQPGRASAATTGDAPEQIWQDKQRALLDRAFELAVEARRSENPRWVTTLAPKSKDGLEVFSAVVRDSKGQFYVFASPMEEAVLGAIVPRSDRKAVVKAWFLDGSSSDAPVGKTLPWVTMTVGPACDVVSKGIAQAFKRYVCTKSIPCTIVTTLIDFMICGVEGAEFRFNPALKSVDWDSEATGESGVSSASQCCGSPYYLVADIHIHANSCHPDDYPNGRREHIRRVCHETDVSGQKTRRQVQWRAAYFWPDGTKTERIYTCECTLLTPAYLYRTVDVDPGEHMLGVSVEEGFEFIGFQATGSAIRLYSLT